MKEGAFVISLDFEIYWGVRDTTKISQYNDNLLGVRRAIPAMLELFSKYSIKATFSTVGFLFFDNKKELLAGLPERIPKYANALLSPYEGHFDEVGDDEQTDPFHFGYSLIKEVQKYEQEIGCHTFSHYYCLEEGQTIADFKADIVAAKRIATKKGFVLKSFVFPRNQYNKEYLNVCHEEGITSFRGNENSRLFSSKNFGKSTRYRRPFRLIDAYFNISGNNCYKIIHTDPLEPVNIPSSRFLRPYSKRLAFLDAFRLKRITQSMTYAAQKGLCYHLWWHPHNFGINLEENINFLEKILQHFQTLQIKYNFQSLSMIELSEKVKYGN